MRVQLVIAITEDSIIQDSIKFAMIEVGEYLKHVGENRIDVQYRDMEIPDHVVNQLLRQIQSVPQ